MLGFEREEKFNEAFQFLTEQCPNIQKIIVLHKLLDKVDPNICVGLFKRRPCKRMLKYIGEVHESFKKGNLYESIDFNGGIYTISGYERLIGCSYFVIVD
jgi:hypothetical protein